MSGGKKKSRTQTKTTQTLSPWSQQQYQKRAGMIDSMLSDNTHGKAYTGPLVAGLSDREQQARGLLENQIGSYEGGFDEGAGIVRGTSYDPRQMVGGDAYDPQALSERSYADFGDVSGQYMNPYESQVVDAVAGDITRLRDEANASTMEQALANRAYGGSGVEVQKSLNNEAAMREMALTMANLRYQGYNDARDYYGRDMDAENERIRYGNENQLTKIGLDNDAIRYGNEQDLTAQQFDRDRGLILTNMADRRHQLGMDDAFALNRMGEVDRGIEQDRMGANYNEFLRQEEDLYRRIAVQQQMLGMTPMLVNSSRDSKSVQKSNPGAMGVIGAAANIGSMFVPGGQIAGLGGLFSRAMSGAGEAGGPMAHAGNTVNARGTVDPRFLAMSGR